MQRATSIGDAAHAACAAYEHADKLARYLAKWDTNLQLVTECDKIHHHNVYVLRNRATGELGVVGCGTKSPKHASGLHHWGRNIQRGAGSMPANIVRRFDSTMREIQQKYGPIDWVAGHSGVCPYFSECPALAGVQKVYFNPDNVVPDAHTVMIATKGESLKQTIEQGNPLTQNRGDPLTWYNGQRHDCILLDGGDHSIKSICKELGEGLSAMPLKDLNKRIGYGNQALQTRDGRLIPNLQDAFEKPLSHSFFKKHKHDLYEQYRKEHPREYDTRKGHPKSKAVRNALKPQARARAIADSKLQERLARHRGIAGSAADETVAGRHIEIPKPEDHVPGLFDDVEDKVVKGFWISAAQQTVMTSMRYLWNWARGEPTEDLVPTVVDGVSAAGETALIAGGAQVTENLLVSQLGINLGGWLGFGSAIVYGFFRTPRMAPPVCHPAVVTLTQQQLLAMEPQQPLTPADFTGITRRVLEDAETDDDIGRLTEQYLDEEAARAIAADRARRRG